MTDTEKIERVLLFLQEKGIEVVFGELKENCFLPGLSIENGAIIIDKDKLKYPGDILHEAAHLAVVPSADRKTLSGPEIGKRKDHAAEEMMAIAWSYAACVHLNINPYFVFHDDGYKGGGKEIADNFSAGRYFGVPMLQFCGMSAEPHMAESLNIRPFPQMEKWLRD